MRGVILLWLILYILLYSKGFVYIFQTFTNFILDFIVSELNKNVKKNGYLPTFNNPTMLKFGIS